MTRSYDPYDLWATQFGVAARKAYYRGNLKGKAAAATIAIADLVAPILARRALGISRRAYPILCAHECLRSALTAPESLSPTVLNELRSLAVDSNSDNLAWGLGFPWMSKNGLYRPNIPFVTHTPYVMEALLALAQSRALEDEAMAMFHGTWAFFESLKVMTEGDGLLALSYAPVEESRIVVNANAYAAFGYAMHAVHGRAEVRASAVEKATTLVSWVVRQQRSDGSWFYYADREPGNFIDGFHSCFVVKNLLKIKQLIPNLSGVLEESAQRGFHFIRSNLYDSRAGMCRRFVVRSHLDPYRWDLYDQAEYLGLLVDFNKLADAKALATRVEQQFRSNNAWYSRIDIFGRRWGRQFLRWGIAPFEYSRARLEQALMKGH